MLPPMQFPVPPADLTSAALLTAVAAFLGGLARGFSGFGAAMVFVPVVAASLGPAVAVAVLLVADLVTASPLIRRAFRACSWPDVRRVAVGAAIGLPIGNHIVTSADPVLVRWVVTILIGLSLALMVSNWKLKVAQTRGMAAGVGVVSGLMSGLAQIGGPPAVMYWLASGIETTRMRSNLIAYFALLMWASLALFLVKGLVTAKVLWLAAAAAPGYALGMYLGAAMFSLASPETFRRIALALVAVATVLGLPWLDPWLR